MRQGLFQALEGLGKVDFEKLKLWPEDKWILSRLNSVEKDSTNAMDVFEFSKALNPCRNFFWLEFADYYIEEVKHRIYGEDKESKKAAQFVLQKVMWETVLMLAPFIPHLAEEIAQGMFKEKMREKSIALESWPKADGKLIDKKAEELGALLAEVISAMRKQKSELGKPLNIPVKKAVVSVPEPGILESAIETIKQTMKVEEVELKKGESLFVEMEF